jgi:hypothetical protein
LPAGAAMSQRFEVHAPTEHGLYLQLFITNGGGV